MSVAVSSDGYAPKLNTPSLHVTTSATATSAPTVGQKRHRDECERGTTCAPRPPMPSVNIKSRARLAQAPAPSASSTNSSGAGGIGTCIGKLIGGDKQSLSEPSGALQPPPPPPRPAQPSSVHVRLNPESPPKSGQSPTKPKPKLKIFSSAPHDPNSSSSSSAALSLSNSSSFPHRSSFFSSSVTSRSSYHASYSSATAVSHPSSSSYVHSTAATTLLTSQEQRFVSIFEKILSGIADEIRKDKPTTKLISPKKSGDVLDEGSQKKAEPQAAAADSSSAAAVASSPSEDPAAAKLTCIVDISALSRNIVDALAARALTTTVTTTTSTTTSVATAAATKTPVKTASESVYSTAATTSACAASSLTPTKGPNVSATRSTCTPSKPDPNHSTPPSHKTSPNTTLSTVFPPQPAKKDTLLLLSSVTAVQKSSALQSPAVAERVKTLVYYLSDPTNAALRAGLVVGRIAPQTFVEMDTYTELCSEEKRREASAAAGGSGSGGGLCSGAGASLASSSIACSLYECPSCGAMEHTLTQLQIRSADEPMTELCQCFKCRTTWRANE